MLVRGVSATPESSPAVVDGTPPASRKRKHAVLGADDMDTVESNDTSEIVLAHDTSRPRLTISRHPVFLPSTDGSPFHMTELCAVNRTIDKIGFKYVPAGLADPGAAIPYRTIESNPMCTRVSWEDRSPFIRVTQDGLGLAGSKGFRSARANVGVQEGKWYMEVKIEKGGSEGAHVRLGWGRREAPLNGPIGLDGYSYGVRDKTGDKVTLSRPRPYGKPFGSGDVVGLYISLPSRRIPNPKDSDDPAHIHRERIAIDFKGQEYFESLDYPQSKEMLALMEHPSKITKADPPQTKKSATVKNLPSDRARKKPVQRKMAPQRSLPILHDSKIEFFINGICQGTAFCDLYDYLQLRPSTGSRKGKDKQRRNRDGPREHTDNHFDDGTLGYYPFFSLFGDAQIRLNPGPDFAFPPPLDPDVDAISLTEPPSEKRTWRPMSERYAEVMSQQWALDAAEEAEAKGEPEKTNKLDKLEKSDKPETPEKPVLNDAQEEKMRLKRERKRKAEAARRKRLKEEKMAAAAAAAAASGADGKSSQYTFDSFDVYSLFTPAPGSSATGAFTGSSVGPSVAPPLAPSVAPSVAPSAANIDMDGFQSTSIIPNPIPGPFNEHNESASVDIMRDIAVPQALQSSDFGGQAQRGNWNIDDDGKPAMRELEPKEELPEQQQKLSEAQPPVPPVLGFEESSTRWTGQ